jgi:hypothetical protein
MSTDMAANYSLENEENQDMALAQKLHWVSSSVFGFIFGLLGISGNILSIIVWSRKKMASSTGSYLIIQAIVDIFVLVFFVLTESLTELFPKIKTSTFYGIFYAWVGYPFFYLVIVLSIWMLVAVTVDRYIHVTYPSRVKVSLATSFTK